MKILQKLLMSALLSIGLLCCLEFIAWTQLPSDIYTGDPAYFWKLKSNLTRQIDNENHPFLLETNQHGYRDDEWGTGQRWLFLGCSTTLGWGVERGEGFVSILDTHFMDVDVMNGGQPGWSTQQVLLNIEEFQSFEPTKVFIGLGVRDAQQSPREDKTAKPSTWIARTNLFTLLQKLKSKPSSQSASIAVSAADQFRVSPTDFKESLLTIQRAFPTADIQLYEFPQVDFSSQHSEVLTQLQAWKTEGFSGADFFHDDPVHLTPDGHHKLARWFIENIEGKIEGKIEVKSAFH